MSRENISRRLGYRIETRMDAEIINQNGKLAKVVIVDISQFGARLEIPYAAELCSTPLLRISSIPYHYYALDLKSVVPGNLFSGLKVELVWRNHYNAGVAFQCENSIYKPKTCSYSVPGSRIPLDQLKSLVKLK